MNKPRVDWLRIIWKCRRKFEWPSKAEEFAFWQCMKFATEELLTTHDIKNTGQLGHKTPRKRRYKNDNSVPPDLNCDDPLYDGVPVF